VVILILLFKTGKIKGKGDRGKTKEESNGARTKFWVLRKNRKTGLRTED